MAADTSEFAELLTGYSLALAAIVAAMERSNFQVRLDLIEILEEFIGAQPDDLRDGPELRASRDLLRFLTRTGRRPGGLTH